jgi:hypothetical protein
MHCTVYLRAGGVHTGPGDYHSQLYLYVAAEQRERTVRLRSCRFERRRRFGFVGHIVVVNQQSDWCSIGKQ